MKRNTRIPSVHFKNTVCKSHRQTGHRAWNIGKRFLLPYGGECSIVVALRFFRSFFSGVEVPPPPRGLSPSQPLVFADPPVNAYRPIALPDETMNFRMAGNCYCDLETRFQESTMYAKYGYIAPRISRRVFPFFRNPEYEKIMISFDKKLDLLVFIRATLYILKNIFNLHRLES